MGQFNKILAALLILLVFLGLALLIFSRLGLLKRITERTTVLPTTTISPTVTPPTPTPTNTTQGGSLLGFLFGSQKSDVVVVATPLPISPTNPIVPTNTHTPQPPPQEKGFSSEEQLYVTVIPYGATNAQNYPATGSPTLPLLIIPATLALGAFLRKSK